MNKNARLFVWMMLGAMLGSTAFAETVKADTPETKSAAEKAAMPAEGGSAAPSGGMEKMKAMTSPTAAHKALEAYAGKWTYTSKMWMSPEAKPEETGGTAENTMIYGGRFLKQEVKGTWMGQPFEGMGFTGYDNIRAQYESVWLDGMATGMMVISGQYDAATKSLNQAGANSCPLTGEKNRQGHSEWKMTDNDHNTYTMYLAGPDGKEFKAMEIIYQRT